MRKMTEDQKQWYLEHKGVCCPFCGTDQIDDTSQNMEIGAGCAWQTVKCTACGEEWCDHYTLTGVTRKG